MLNIIGTSIRGTNVPNTYLVKRTRPSWMVRTVPWFHAVNPIGPGAFTIAFSDGEVCPCVPGDPASKVTCLRSMGVVPN